MKWAAVSAVGRSPVAARAVPHALHAKLGKHHAELLQTERDRRRREASQGGHTMATNPFEAEDGLYFALRNDEGQFSLWPTTIRVPDGWERKHGPSERSSCLEYIEREWTDMRPVSLIAKMQH